VVFPTPPFWLVIAITRANGDSPRRGVNVAEGMNERQDVSRETV
jgi:hypothetical protein